MKRTLLIANGCFSDIEANGRTLKMLFKGAEPDKLAQFYTYGTPDYDFCRHYYQVSDGTALRSIKPGFNYDGKQDERPAQGGQEAGQAPAAVVNHSGKTPFKMCLRELAWKLGHWDNANLWQWVQDFNPELIVLFVANNTFTVRLAIEVAKRYRLPIIVYSTEGYCFMDFNYFTWRPSLWYGVFYRGLNKALDQLTPYVSEGFFNIPLLAAEYRERFGYNTHTIMNSSTMTFMDKTDIGQPPRLVYTGNLGNNRHLALMEIGKELSDMGLNVDVYGPPATEADEEELRKAPGINFHGFVSYDTVQQVTREADLLIHVEYDDDRTNRYFKYAFSTKIADSICSGTPLLVYGNAEFAFMKFLKEQGCAFVVSDRQELNQALNKALNDKFERAQVIACALRTKREYLTGNKEFFERLE